LIVVPTADHPQCEHTDIDREGTWKLIHLVGNFQQDDAGPQAVLADFRPPEPLANGNIAPHFHKVRQFQLFVEGDARLGKRPMPAVAFHYDDPYKTYGPIFTEHLKFFVLRADGDVGKSPMPGSLEEMIRQNGRAIAVQVDPTSAERSEIEPLIEPHDDGLAAYRMILRDGETLSGPAACGDGQYYVVVRGSASIDGRELSRLSLIFRAPGDDAPELTGRETPTEIMVLQFPVEDGPSRGKRHQ
jgi:hypothetical protein